MRNNIKIIKIHIIIQINAYAYAMFNNACVCMCIHRYVDTLHAI